jgi:peptide/nickel transport system substrate-binding protein
LTRAELLQRVAAGGLVLGAPGLLAACGSDGGAKTTAAATTSATAAKPVRGGRLRVGWVGGGAAETLDPGLGYAMIDSGRANNIFDKLVRSNPDLSIGMELAESLEPNADATEWTIRLRPDVVWHDGKSFTADDVIYTLRRAGNPKYIGSGTVASFDLRGLKKVDPLTFRLPLKRPIAQLAESFVYYPLSIFQDGATDFTKPVGTGPFMLDSFTAGQSSLFKKNPNYWREGQPYVDELEYQSIPDGVARLNALNGGTVDAIESVSFTQAKAAAGKDGMTVLEGKGPVFQPMYMAVDLKPFDDVRIRQAMRLIVDRPALLESVQLGYGQIGNDLYGKGMANYAADIPQRTQDLEQAKSLLKKAGAEDLRVTLHTSSIAGMLEAATLFAEQAKGAGVKVKVVKEPEDTYFTSLYLKLPFAQTLWNPVPMSNFYDTALRSTGLFNETHWKTPKFDKLLATAEGELDKTKAASLWGQVQKTLWDEGGYIVWGFQPWLDGVSSKVGGAKGYGFGPLSNHNFREWWLT